MSKYLLSFIVLVLVIATVVLQGRIADAAWVALGIVIGSCVLIAVMNDSDKSRR